MVQLFISKKMVEKISLFSQLRYGSGVAGMGSSSVDPLSLSFGIKGISILNTNISNPGKVLYYSLVFSREGPDILIKEKYSCV